MSLCDLSNKRILLTQAADFMGPALQRTLESCGAEIIADTRDFLDPKAPQKLIADAGEFDVLLLNLGVPAPSTPADQVADEEWGLLFRHMVDPLPRFARAVLPAMTARGHGKIVLMGSASALRGMKRASSYSAARGAQLASSAERKKLQGWYAPHNKELYTLIGRDFGWEAEVVEA